MSDDDTSPSNDFGFSKDELFFFLNLVKEKISFIEPINGTMLKKKDRQEAWNWIHSTLASEGFNFHTKKQLNKKYNTLKTKYRRKLEEYEFFNGAIEQDGETTSMPTLQIMDNNELDELFASIMSLVLKSRIQDGSVSDTGNTRLLMLRETLNLKRQSQSPSSKSEQSLKRARKSSSVEPERESVNVEELKLQILRKDLELKQKQIKLIELQIEEKQMVIENMKREKEFDEYIVVDKGCEDIDEDVS